MQGAVKGRKIKTLVVNLTRFGDLVQSQPTVGGLAGAGREVGVVCLANFREAAAMLSGASAVFPMPGERFLSPLRENWLKALAGLRAFLAEARDEFGAGREVEVVNLTPSLSARLMSRLLGGDGCRGMALDDHGFSANTTPWASFLQTASSSRVQSPFNVVDVFCRVAGLDPGRGDFSMSGAPVPQALTAGLARIPEAQGAVAFQLGASEERRRWPVGHFARLGEELWNRHRLVPVLVGGPGEERLSARYAAAAAEAPCLDMVGRTSLSGLAGVLGAVKLLVTNDTGTMHLACGLSVPVLAIFLATAQPWDTGPYQEGAICVEPDLECHPCGFGQPCEQAEACRRAVAPETILSLSRMLMGLGQPGEVERGRARIWTSLVDGEGYMSLAPICGTLHGVAGDRYAWPLLFRRHLSRFLDGLPQPGASPDIPPLTPETAATLAATLEQAGQLATLVATQGQALASLPREALKAKFLGFWRRLEAVFAANPRLSILARLLTFESREAGRGLPELIDLAGRAGDFARAMSAAVAPFKSA